jgi:hypothetical protein
MDDKVGCREGNSPEHWVRSLSISLVGKGFFEVRTYREIGLEAAIL